MNKYDVYYHKQAREIANIHDYSVNYNSLNVQKNGQDFI